MGEIPTLYSVDELAEMTALTSRTIRNYLRNGTLKGRKIGGQWRFNQTEVTQFLQQGKVVSDMQQELRQSVMDFFDGFNTDLKGPAQSCTVLDLYISRSAAMEKSNRLCQLINRGGTGSMSYRFDYISGGEKARYVLFATPEFLTRALAVLTDPAV